LPLENDVGPDAQLGLGRGPGLGVALVLVVLLSLSAGVANEAQAIWPFDRLLSRPPLAERAVALLAEAIRIPTVNPPGNEGALARRLAQVLDRAGIEHGVIETPGPEGGPVRAAVWGRLRGNGERPGLALLSHLDTVPADASEWSVKPFAGEIWDGFIWGRGALDAKGVAVTHLMTMVELAESGARLSRDILYLATPEEETGGRLGAGWLVEHHPELLEGIGYLLTEGGGIQLPRNVDGPRPPVWGVALTEKAPCWLELRASGRSGHSSAPTPDAAVPRLVAALDKIRRSESPIRVTDEVAQMFAALAPLAAEWDQPGFRDLATQLASDEGFRQRFLGNPGQNALVRNTVSITVLEGAPKTNVAPASARAQLDARLLPGESCESFAESLVELIDDESVEIEEILSFPARASTSRTPLFRAIQALAAQQEPAGLVVPRMIGGFTDAHWFREVGLIAYGFVPRALTAEESRRVHGLDERVAVQTLIESIQLSVELVRTFDRLESATPESARWPKATPASTQKASAGRPYRMGDRLQAADPRGPAATLQLGDDYPDEGDPIAIE
jgi:acetylornithine deacetylase/succinyl-diaminopimelate desuccinylase-like protein